MIEWLNWPENIDDAIAYLENSMTGDDLRRSVSDPTAKYHFGMQIRNSFGLWGGNSKLLDSCGTKTMHADDASDVIIDALIEKLGCTPPPATE